MKLNNLFLTLLLGCFLSILMLTENRAAFPPGDVFLSSQDEVDDFVGSSITGDLYIYGSDITDLSPLSSLTSVSGNLGINNTALTSLSGLGALTSIGGSLTIQGNSSLASLSGLDALTFVGGYLEFLLNDVLTEFCSLYPLLNDGGFMGGIYLVFGNASNPTQQQIIDGGPCSLPPTVSAGDDVTFLYGYDPSVTLTATASDGTPPYTYEWVPGGSGQSITVSPTTTTTYTVTVTDASGQTASDDVVVTVEDVRCGNNLDKVSILHRKSNGSYVRICISPNAIADHLAHGDVFVLPKSGVADEGAIPTEHSLTQNFPNPFNPSTVINYSLPTASNVKLEVFNVTGEKVATLVDGFKSEGYYEVSFDASGLPSGLYLYRISAGAFVTTKKMVLLR